VFLDRKEQWLRLRENLLRQKVIGLDTEFEGVDFAKGDSCVNLAKVDVWSVAVSTGKWHPRGYHTAKGCVLPVDALDTLKDVLENPDITKALHNSNVDVHALYNLGVDLHGVVNTLSLARWVRPGRLTYNLDDLSRDYLGSGKAYSFKELFVVDDIQLVNKPKKVKLCMCGVEKCRKRTFPEHHKWEELQDNFVEKRVGKKVIPLHTVRPGHELWEKYVEYAKVDAVRALELYDFMILLGQKIEVDIPWYGKEA
jgi:DNA polymerase I-like protein with 3'-5' exonuclease and polymerase domains